jgi:hypothetical protein
VLEGVKEATITLEAEATSEAGGASSMAGNDGATDAAAAIDVVEEAPNQTEEGAAVNEEEDQFDGQASDKIPANMNICCMKAIDQHFPKQCHKGNIDAANTFISDGHIFVVAMAQHDTGGAEGGKS